jgi:hypothetical protein
LLKVISKKGQIPGYVYGSSSVASSHVSLVELGQLKISVGLTDEDIHFLKMAGEVLGSQTQQIVAHWRSGIIATIPHLARHSRSPDNQPLPDYLARSNRRFEQWILDTCQRDYDQDWLNYQMEIAARHTSLKKNQTDAVISTSYVPYRDIIAFTAVMNQTIKPYLAAGGHPPATVNKMHEAWCKSLQLQIALWGRIYCDSKLASQQW